ncbi:hypothetical protein PF001_g29348 [Phytophthora fragariae]|uniref:Uncharacterized protein n=1 Tax=Phytophthora fragariae TaxID=53985 RepID=A0A6A4B4X6_9STRA|nr:hypothetical protein PF004_g28748 [Phytophthora fragariae]KAE9269157.1 hypothetical protein PF001_g29348 [Phytophthora fragariae]
MATKEIPTSAALLALPTLGLAIVAMLAEQDGVEIERPLIPAIRSFASPKVYDYQNASSRTLVIASLLPSNALCGVFNNGQVE